MSKVAFVTGGASGIGRAISLRLARDGFNIAVADLKSAESAGSEVVNEIAKLGRQGAFIAADVTDSKSLGDAIRESNKLLNGFDVIVNNAGVGILGAFENITPQDLSTLFQVNVNGVVFGIQEATKMFKELGHGGKIINASSLSGCLGYPGFGAYSASKFAVRGLTQTAAQELAPLGITVNAYCPGATQTPMLELFGKSMPASELGGSGGLVPALKRLARPEEIAGLVSFLAGEDSSYITGQSIVVDGGTIFR